MTDPFTKPRPQKSRFILGFYSLPDLITTLFVPSGILNDISAGFVWLTALIGWIYPDAAVVKILFGVMIFDWITGVFKAYKMKTFNSFTFQRMLLNLVLTFGLIGFATSYAKTMWVFRMLHLNEVLMTGFMLTYLVSVIENLHVIDERLIPLKFYNYLKNILAIDNVLKNYFKKNPSENNPETPTDTGDAPSGLPNDEESQQPNGNPQG